jgi:hypothetical protein
MHGFHIRLHRRGIDGFIDGPCRKGAVYVVPGLAPAGRPAWLYDTRSCGEGQGDWGRFEYAIKCGDHATGPWAAPTPQQLIIFLPDSC